MLTADNNSDISTVHSLARPWRHWFLSNIKRYLDHDGDSLHAARGIHIITPHIVALESCKKNMIVMEKVVNTHPVDVEILSSRMLKLVYGSGAVCRVRYCTLF